MLNWHVLSFAVASFQIFVQRGENLRKGIKNVMSAKKIEAHLAVENLEPSDAVDHPLQLDPLDVLVLPIHPLHSEDVVAEVQALEPDDLLSVRYRLNYARQRWNLLCCPSRTIITAPAQLRPSPNSCSTVNSFSPTGEIIIKIRNWFVPAR